MTATLTYVYCLVRQSRPPAVRRAPAGMPGGGPVRALNLEHIFPPAPPRRPSATATGRSRPGPNGLWLIVSSVPERAYGEAALQRGLRRLEWVGPRAMAHEAVVEHFLAAAAVLPMQLFTLFTSDERAVEHVARDRRRIRRMLSRIEGQVEWGLRLTWDERAAREAVARAHGGGGGGAGKAGGAGRAGGSAGVVSGAAYLARKRDLLAVTRTELASARAAAARLFRAVSREASAARRQTATEQAAPASPLLLDAAFLVPVRRAAAFRAAVRRHTRELGAVGIQGSLTGPWPPYNFV